MKTVITSHKNADFDALASMIAAMLLYPDSMPLMPKPLNPNVKAFLSLHKDLFSWVEKKPADLGATDRLIVVDAGQWERLNSADKLRNQSDLEILMWDHHLKGPGIPADWHCIAPVGANITLMLRCLKAEDIRLSPIQATLFLAGLYEDTGHLTFTGTTAEDAYAAAYLLEQGADLGILTKFLRPAYGVKQKNVLFDMLKNARRVRLNGHRLSISKLEVQGHVESLALVVGMYRDIMNVDAAFGIFNDPTGKCIVIGRSDAQSLNIGDIMRSLGGGGHPGAGSTMLRGVNPDAVENMIRDLIGGNQQASVRVSDLMSFPVHMIDADMTMEKAAEMLRTKGCTGLPVKQGGRLEGMISRRDFQKVRNPSKLQAPVKAFMCREVKTIEPFRSPLQAARIMVRHDIGRLPVVENGQMIGIITRSDIMRYFYDLLPE